jgi:hypothetical protein
MDGRDRLILEYCTGDFRALRPLTEQMPAGSLYRHAKRLVALRWLQKEGALYQTTAAGLRQLVALRGGRPWDTFERSYPPLSLVPTRVHRALIELILAALVARRHESRPDRHPFFVAVGSTLHWKTSLGLFVCYALGVDPNVHVVDCASESGKSLTIRRGGTGEPLFKRELLDAPFVVLDEFLTADPTVRAALSIVLGGRLVVPFENAQLRIRPVPLLTMNPRPKSALEQRIGLSPPQIRRAILVDLDAVAMPDLAVTGEQALEAARAHRPLELGPPAVDCRAFHDRIVALTRAIVAPEAQARVDVEIVINLATGMTAVIADPAEAIAQVGYDLGLLVETLGWARPGWIQPVTDFSLTPGKNPSTRDASPRAVAPVPESVMDQNTPPEQAGTAPPATMALAVREPVHRKGHVPDIALSEATRMRLVWFAHETGRDVDGAIDLLLDFYLEWRANAQAIETMERILTLARELELAGIEADTLRDYLADCRLLAESNCSFADLPAALQVLDLLNALPIEWDWAVATAAMQGAAAIMRAGIPASQVDEFVGRHQRLEALGFLTTAEALAAALIEAGAVEDRRDAVLRHLVESATVRVDREQLDEHVDSLRAQVAALEAQTAQLEGTVAALEQRRERLRQDIAAAQVALAQVDAERAVQAGALDVVAAFKALLLQKTVAGDAFFAELRKLDGWRAIGGAPDDVVGRRYVTDLRAKLVALLLEMFRQAGSPQP